MSEFIQAPPIAENFIKTLRKFGYTMQSAIADIIDNSISASAKNINIIYLPNSKWLSIIDDGNGMTKNELISAMTQDYGQDASVLRIDGGMARNNWMAQYLSNMTALEVQRPTLIETTALGAARLAGLQAGLYGSLKPSNSESAGADHFTPTLDSENRHQRMMSWERAVKSVLQYAQKDSWHESTAGTV